MAANPDNTGVMNRCYVGEFGPELENAFIKDLTLEIHGAGGSVCVVTPTAALAKHLTSIFLRANPSITTLACDIVHLDLFIEMLSDDVAHDLTVIDDNHLIAMKIRQLCRSKPPFHLHRNALYLAGAIEDLEQAGVDPTSLAELDRETDSRPMRFIAGIYSALQTETARSKHITKSRLLQLISSALNSSRQLARYKSLLIYGFYDLNELQTDLILSALNLPKRFYLYLPVGVNERGKIESTVYEYARPLIENYLLPHVASRQDFKVESVAHNAGAIELAIRDSIEHNLPLRTDNIAIFSTCSVFETALHTLTNVKELINAGNSPHDIAIMARDITKYSDCLHRLAQSLGVSLSFRLKRMFAPQDITALTSVIELKATGINVRNFNGLIRLLPMPETDRDSADSVLARLTGLGDDGILDKSVSVTSSIFKSGLVQLTPEESKVFSKCRSLYKNIKRLLKRLKQEDTISNYKKWLAELMKALNYSTIKASNILSFLAPYPPRQRTGIDALSEILSSIPLFSRHNADGVMVADCMSLRGTSYKYVFLLGLNHDEFPTQIYDDPLLPDACRIQIRASLGNRITVKTERFHEEKLLYYLSCKTATEKLFIYYQRADSKGDEIAPSIFIEPLISAQGVTSIPRLNFTFKTQAVTPPPIRKRLADKAEAMFGKHSSITEYEGLSIVNARQKLNSTVSASGVKTFHECRFKFFCEKILRLRGDTIGETVQPLPAVSNLVIGNLVDMLYKRTYLSGGRSAYKPPRFTKGLSKIIGRETINSILRSARQLLEVLRPLTGGRARAINDPDKTLRTNSAGWYVEGKPDLVLRTRNGLLIIEIKYHSKLKELVGTKNLGQQLLKSSYVQHMIYPLFYRGAQPRFVYLNSRSLLEHPISDELFKYFGETSEPHQEWWYRAFVMATENKGISGALAGLLREMDTATFPIRKGANPSAPPCSNCAFSLACHRNIHETRLRARSFGESASSEKDEQSRQEAGEIRQIL